jgi:hypothetical protein
VSAAHLEYEHALVYVQNDNGVNSSYSYRLFETISKLRENNINDILNLIENEG